MLHQHHPSYEEKSCTTDNNERNFHKLLFIQSLLVTGKAPGAVYSTFEDLVSTGRIFIKETDLRKVCRKQNKTFHFWLFNDCLIYGYLLDTGKYLFHRKIDLITSTVSAYRSVVYKCALEISGAEKSFIVMASNEYEQMQWLKLIQDAICAIRGIEEFESNDFDGPSWKLSPTIDATSSPLWNNQDSIEVESVGRHIGNYNSEVKCCAVCSEAFSVFNRRYECVSCGIDVCLEHSSHEISFNHQQQGMSVNHYRTCNRCCTVHNYGDSSDDDEEDEEEEEGDPNIVVPQIFKPSPPPKPMRVHNSPGSEVCYGGTNPRPLFRTSSFSRSTSVNVEGPPPPPPPPIARLAVTVPIQSTPLLALQKVSVPTTPERSNHIYQPLTPESQECSSSHDSQPLSESSFQQKLAAMKQKCAVAVTRPMTPTTSQPILNNIVLGYIATIKEPKLKLEEQVQKEQYEAEQQKRRAFLGVYDPYDRMIDMRTPMITVKQKMVSDGFSGAEIQAYFLAMDRSREKPVAATSTSASNPPSSQRSEAGNSPQNDSSYVSPSSVSSRSPVIKTDSVSSPHVRVASMLFKEKMDALNKKSSKPLLWPEAVRDNHSQSDKVMGFKKSSNSDPNNSSHPNSPVRSFSLSQSVPAVSPGQWRSNPTQNVISTSANLPLSTPSTPGQQPSSTSASQSASERPYLSNSVGERVSRLNSTASSYSDCSSFRGDSLNQTYPATRRSSDDFDEALYANIGSASKQGASPFTRADTKSSSNQSPEVCASASPTESPNVNEVKSTKSSRKSTCEIVDSVALESREPASTLRTSSLSEVKKNVEPGSMESLSSRTTVESSSSTTTVTYTYEYDVDTDEDDVPIRSGSKKSRRRDKSKNPSNFSEKDVRMKMEEDGVCQEDIEEFLKQLVTAMKPQKSDKAKSSTTHLTPSTEVIPELFPVSTRVMEMPVNHCSRVAATAAMYTSYDKMRLMKVPDGAVLQKMYRDGLNESEIDAYFSTKGEDSTFINYNSPHVPPPPPPPPPPPANCDPPIEIRYSYGSVPSKGRQTLAPSSSIPPKESKSRKESNDGSTCDNAIERSSSRRHKLRDEEAKNIESKTAAGSTVRCTGVEKKKENPVSRLFASIRSGVTLTKSDRKEIKEVGNIMTPLSKKGPISLHGMLAHALESRRQSSNLEKSESIPSVESAVDFDPDMN